MLHVVCENKWCLFCKKSVENQAKVAILKALELDKTTGQPAKVELKLPVMSMHLLRELRSVVSRGEMCVGAQFESLLSALSLRFNLPDASGIVSSSPTRSVVGFQPSMSRSFKGLLNDAAFPNLLIPDAVHGSHVAMSEIIDQEGSFGFNGVHHRGTFGDGNYFASHFPYSARENFAKNKMHLCKSCGFLTDKSNDHCNCTAPCLSTVRELLYVAVDIGSHDNSSIMAPGDPREAKTTNKFTKYDDCRSARGSYHSAERLRFYVATTGDITTTGFVQIKPSCTEVVAIGIIYVEAQ